MASPYQDLPEDKWLEKTKQLVEEHPLDLKTIEDVASKSWNNLWSTTIGENELAIKLIEINPTASLIGDFFEKLFAKELNRRYPTLWRGGTRKVDKDIVYLPNDLYSIEIKISGQDKFEIFGNRSYALKKEKAGLENEPKKAKIVSVQKQKSGYYITVNYSQTYLKLIRFGWIDHSDWEGQKKDSGQSAGLNQKVYEYKLIRIPGDYQLNVPVIFLPRVTKEERQILNEEGISIVLELKNYQGKDKRIIKIQERLEKYISVQ